MKTAEDSKNKLSKLGTHPFSKDELLEVIVYNGHLICIGFDEPGQSYFVVYEDKDCIQTESLTAYQTDICDYIEWKFGNPELCKHYYNDEIEQCEYKDKGYCGMCKKYDYREYQYQKLLNLGIIDRHANITNEYSTILEIKR